MGSVFSTCRKGFSNDIASSNSDELVVIRDHPARVHNRSSLDPNFSMIFENPVLEEICEALDVEPDIPEEKMDRMEMIRFVRRVSITPDFNKNFPDSTDHLIDKLDSHINQKRRMSIGMTGN